MNREAVAVGVWAAWRLGLPLTIAGKQIFVPDELGASLNPDTQEGLDQEASDPPSPHAVARQVAWLMRAAERWITEAGIEIGALANSDPQGAGFKTHPPALLAPDSSAAVSEREIVLSEKILSQP